MIELNSSDPINYDLDSSTDAISSFPRLTQPISYDDFFREFLEKNKPCVFSSEFTREWRARSDWVTPIGIPDVQYFVEQFGDADVPVADCDQKHYDSQEKKTYKLKDYIHYWNGLRETSCGKNQCLYLKDWHFVQAYPDYGAYTTLHYFASDWLNEFWQVRDDIQDDYQFVYMGPKGSWTPFHADVFRSYSWSANVCGRKRWVFYPPGEDQYLRDPFGTPIYDIDSSDLSDSSKYPKAASASGRLEVIQEQGETIFVPSGWHHQVWNLEDTISINHNWLNGTNIQVAWHFLVESLNQVEFAIQDCKDMEDWVGQCQLLLRVTHGMDYKEFYTFLRTVAQRRISCLSENKPLVSFDVWTVGKNHILYDLKKIQWCLEQLLNDERLDSIKDFSDEENHPVKLLDDITTVLS
ncbi:2-oxoglutarate and iron-dependent oxygenase JMJD4-like isoform X1 [Macrobrachium nipponense]|uniref:2-oxoglutarate and iron-dependent oxygenase JMJD4-like isoform X1 n=2 Tax=Macrobrachium nipponense TaxID=159736 RepID=UPI0030C7E80B